MVSILNILYHSIYAISLAIHAQASASATIDVVLDRILGRNDVYQLLTDIVALA